jgi:putative CocE/NonD family hydrolase
MLAAYLEPALGFFDAFLAGRRDPATVPRVRWHLASVGWQESSRWPPPGASTLRLHLASDGALTATMPERGQVAWTHDPDDLVPSTLVNPFTTLLEYPDERAIDGRDDVVLFTTDALAEPLTLAGRVVAFLEIGSDAPSVHLHAKLVDVHPDGRAHALLFGQTVVRDPGDGVVAEVYLGHTGYAVGAGHRLRLQVATSDFPVFLPHPGTDENPWYATTTRRNRQTLASGGTTPSCVELTVLPPGSAHPVTALA